MPPFVLGKNTKLRAKGIARRILWCCASNFNSIEDALQQNDDFITERNRPFYANPWGIEFWSYYVSGKDVLEGDVSDSKIEKIAWITTTAADTISTKEDEVCHLMVLFFYILYYHWIKFMGLVIILDISVGRNYLFSLQQ
ncbi:hypothetical protein ACS0TY_002132 [Phlomoides rotata]